MGRDFRDVAVVKAYAENGQFVVEEILPLDVFAASGSELINSVEARKTSGIRLITLRLFDTEGKRIQATSFSFAANGKSIKALHRRLDGSIIEDADKYV